jgi:predicted P-loop ATPase
MSVFEDTIPQRLRDKNQWVLWRYTTRNGKRTKEPINAKTGRRASSTDPQTWTSFRIALQSKIKSDGLGYVFAGEETGIDLDHAYEKESASGLGIKKLKPWAREILDQCQTYTEQSPSGMGLHLIVAGGVIPPDQPGRKRKHHDGAVEIYSRARFFTITGHPHLPTPPLPITDQSAYVLELYKKLGGSTRNGANRKRNSTGGINDRGINDCLERALKDPVFSSLWYGDINNYPSQSEADLALCNKIVQFFGHDPDVVDRLFRQSKLYREKWERADYRNWTINKAINDTPETYKDPRKTSKKGGSTDRTKSQSGPINDSDEKSDSKNEEKSQTAENDLDAPPRLANLNNAVRIIEKDPNFCRVWFDEFLQRILTDDPPREWSEADDVHLTLRFQRDKGIPRMGIETVRHAVTEIAFRRKKNCVKDWFQSLKWDKTDRIEHFFEDHFGTAGNVYVRKASRNFWISMVARIYKPGCQVDNMIVLEGPQGIKKSSALRLIAGNHHAEQHESVTQKDFLQNLQGKLLIEISEMDSFSKTENAKVKAVITTTTDHFRPTYGHRVVDHPRQCVFVGTTNHDDWNKDPTGARRFWPIACRGDIDLDAIRSNRDQLFAEAVHRFKAGETWWEMPTAETQSEQESRYVDDPWTNIIADYIQLKTAVEMIDILTNCLKFNVDRIGKADEMRAATCLRRLGWTKGKNERFDGRQVRLWRPEA